MLFRNPRVFAFVLLATGLGLAGWYGEEWLRLPEWSEAEIAQSTELNLQLDLQRMGAQLAPTGERLDELRRIVRAEVEAEVRHDRETVARWLGLGLLLAVLGLGQLVLSFAFPRRAA
ncbi:MAG TPA: hypothetical protein VM369_09895 [Candidatus Binatia bacterium]|nr:hypothetical protein [Candidatus Binatia bacterium]